MQHFTTTAPLETHCTRRAATSRTTGGVKSKLRGVAHFTRRRLMPRPKRKNSGQVEAVEAEEKRRADEASVEEASRQRRRHVHVPEKDVRCFLLDCTEALPRIIAHLDGRALAALASSCKTLRDLAEGDDGKRWWTRRCTSLLVGARGC